MSSDQPARPEPAPAGPHGATDGSAHRKIRRSRRSRAEGTDKPKPAPPPQRPDGEPEPNRAGESGHRRRGQSREDRDAERTLRGLIGAGQSMVGPVGAMRARDVARPTEADLAEAERDVVIVRRNYVPPDRPIPGVRPGNRRERGGQTGRGSSPEDS